MRFRKALVTNERRITYSNVKKRPLRTFPPRKKIIGFDCISSTETKFSFQTLSRFVSLICNYLYAE